MLENVILIRVVGYGMVIAIAILMHCFGLI